MIPWILHPATPWIFAIAAFVLGLIMWRSSREHKRVGKWVLGAIGGLALLLGSLMLIGAGATAYIQADALKRYPAPGKMVDVGGYRLHVLCKGPKTAKTVVWLPGSYGQAYWIYPAHADMARETRSCIIDRGGTGWADIGPFPRSIDTVLAETRSALLKSGENAPFVLVGHSFGGLYAANFAQRYRNDVAGVVLFDPTAPAWQALFAADGCRPQDGSFITMFGTMYGLAYIDALNPLRGPGLKLQRERLGNRWEALIAWELRPAARWSQRSAMTEICKNFYSIARTPGSLGDMPLLLIPQTPDLAEQKKWSPKELNKAELRNYFNFNRFVSTEMAAMSSRSKTVFAPPGATHMILDTQPDFATQQVREFVAGLDGRAAP